MKLYLFIWNSSIKDTLCKADYTSPTTGHTPKLKGFFCLSYQFIRIFLCHNSGSDLAIPGSQSTLQQEWKQRYPLPADLRTAWWDASFLVESTHIFFWSELFLQPVPSCPLAQQPTFSPVLSPPHHLRQCRSRERNFGWAQGAQHRMVSFHPGKSPVKEVWLPLAAYSHTGLDSNRARMQLVNWQWK